MGALIRVHRLQIQHMANHAVFIGDAIATVHVPATRAISSALPQLLRFMREIASGAARQASNSRPKCRQALNPRVISVAYRPVFLDQLIGSKGSSELLALQYVLPGRMPAGLCRPMAPQAIP